MRKMSAMVRAMVCAVMVTGMMLAAAFSSEAADCGDSFVRLQDTRIYVHENVTEEQRAEALSEYALLPENVRARLAEREVNIYVIPESVSGITIPGTDHFVDGKKIVGKYTSPRYNIYADGRIEEDGRGCMELQADRISYAMIHETGHFVDDTWGKRTGRYVRPSDRGEFCGFYERSMSALQGIDRSTRANTYNAQEAFAESFRLYLKNPEALRAAAPEVYEYMERMVAEL